MSDGPSASTGTTRVTWQPLRPLCRVLVLCLGRLGEQFSARPTSLYNYPNEMVYILWR